MLNQFAHAFVALALTFSAAIAQTTSSPLQPGPHDGLFLIVTDIHFDPFAKPDLVPKLDQSPVSEWAAIFREGAGNDFQGYGDDAGYPLMASALQAAAAQKFDYDYVLYTGDYLSHGFNDDYKRFAGSKPLGITSFSIKTTQFVSRLLNETFGDIPVLGVMGNTDSACGDYQIAPDSDYLVGLSDQWARLSDQPERFTQFRAGGYYKVAHPTLANQDIIVLNNIFWTPRYSDDCNSDGGDPGTAMMSWLDHQLNETKQAGRKAQILMHVPPGMNAYSSSNRKGACDQRLSPFWQDQYANGFVGLMRKYAGLVDYTFSGHTHMDSFAIIKDASGAPLVASQITPAVSPIFGNNPAFAVFLYDRRNGELKDSETFYLTNLPDTKTGAKPNWQTEYTYRATYAIPDLTAKSRSSAAKRIKNDPGLRAKFTELYAVSTQSSNPITASNWQAYSCAQTEVEPAAYQTCYCDEK
ncbi:MAG: metallophosphoesterase [Roseibium sp.]